MQINCLFTTGRTGTAFLSSCFGHGAWSKTRVFKTEDGVTFHENMRSKLFYISKLKKLNDLDSNEAFDLQRRTVNSIVSRVGEAGRVFVTDLKMKWTCWALPKMSDMDYKVIYIERPKEDTVNSFLKRHRLRLKRRGSKHFRSFFKRAASAVIF